MSNAANKLLLIGWDAAEWKVLRPLLDAGLMPNLRSLIARGASGPLISPYPLLSPMLWTSAVTGKRAHKHNILGPFESRPDRAGTRPIRRSSMTAAPIWRILDRAGIESCSVNFPASHPAESLHGASVSNLFALANDPEILAASIQPPEAREALLKLRVEPNDIDRASLLTFVPRANEIDRRTDGRLAAVERILAHIATVHAAATWCLENVPWRFAALCYTGLHQFSHPFMPYHPPERLEVISQRDADLYGGVVTAAYRFHDMMLGRLLEIAGENTNVVLISDHGFRSDHLRPHGIAPANVEAMLAWHRQEGVIVMTGPRIAWRGENRLRSARLFDIAPTILSVFDLPVGADMDGKSLDDALLDPPHLEPRATWEQSGAEERPIPADDANDESIRHLIDLGYIERPDPHARNAIENVERDNRYAMAVSWLESGWPGQAIELLEPLVRARPRQIGLRITLSRAYATAHRIADSRRLVDELVRDTKETSVSTVAIGLLELAARRADAALEHFERAEAMGVRAPDVLLAMGQAYIRLQQWNAARRVLGRAIELDPDQADAIGALAVALIGGGELNEAVSAARQATAMRPDRAVFHYHLGIALFRAGALAEAVTPLNEAIRIDPQFVAAHRRLADVCSRRGDEAAAARHRREARAVFIQHRMAHSRRTHPPPSA